MFALRGDLGAGKTTFVQGFLKGLGSRARVTSPTFILMRRYRLKGKKFSNVFHIDAYRLKTPGHLSALELGAVFADPRSIVLVEWPERAGRLLPKNSTRVTFAHGKKENERIVAITMPPPPAPKKHP